MIGALLLVFLGAAWLQVACRPPLVGYHVRRLPRWPGVFMLAAGFSMACVAPAHATTPPSVPEASAMYRRWVEQAVAEEWGVEGSAARLAAQIHQESSWNPKARSAVGAEGLAQFMPSTARWITSEFPETLGQFDPWDPQQAALAAAVYDAWLVGRNPGRTECDTWSFALSAYNGGEKQLRREQLLAASRGKAADVWFGHVADARTRSLAAWRENRAYVTRILLVLEPLYLSAGWSGKRGCPP